MLFRKASHDRAADTVRDIDPQDLTELGAQVRIVDVREPAEWAGDLPPLPRSQCVPLAQVGDAQTSWSKSEPVLLVCRSGRRSRTAAELLIGLGFEHVMNLRGGLLALHGRP